MRCKEAEVVGHRAIMKRGKAIEERKEYLEGIQKEKVMDGGRERAPD